MDGFTSIPARLTITLHHVNGHAEVLLIGELDVSTAAKLRGALNRLIQAGHRELRLNLSALSFLDAAGVGALVDVNRQLLQLHGHLRVTAVRGIPYRVLEICGLLEPLTERDPGTAAIPPPAGSPQ